MGYIFSYTMGLSFVVQVGNPFLGVLPGCRVDRRGPVHGVSEVVSCLGSLPLLRSSQIEFFFFQY